MTPVIQFKVRHILHDDSILEERGVSPNYVTEWQMRHKANDRTLEREICAWLNEDLVDYVGPPSSIHLVALYAIGEVQLRDGDLGYAQIWSHQENLITLSL